MKKSLVLLLLALLTLSGCYYQLPDDASPIGEVLSSPRPSGDMPSDQPNTPQGTVYAQNVNVANCGFIWRVNSVKVTKDAGEVAEDGPLADYMADFKPFPGMSDDLSYMVINMTVTNPFPEPYTAHLHRLNVAFFNEHNIPTLLPYEAEWYFGMWAFDKTQHPKSWYYWWYTLEPSEEMTANYLFILDTPDLEKNLFLALHDWESGYFNSITHENTRLILLHNADESTLLATPVTEDTPPPEKASAMMEPNTNEDHTSKEKLKPGQIFQKGEEVSQFDLLFRLNSVEVIPDYPGYDWYPLEITQPSNLFGERTDGYNVDVAKRKRDTPDFEPCVVMLNLTVKNPSDVPGKLDINQAQAISFLNKNNTLTPTGLESLWCELRPFASALLDGEESYNTVEMGAGEELTYSVAYFCDSTDIERMRGQELCLMLGPNISAAKVITFRLEE